MAKNKCQRFQILSYLIEAEEHNSPPVKLFTPTRIMGIEAVDLRAGRRQETGNSNQHMD